LTEASFQFYPRTGLLQLKFTDVALEHFLNQVFYFLYIHERFLAR
jgi:hypothetical protein